MTIPDLNQELTLKIHNLGNGGEGVGSYEGYTLFVDGALPGEFVRVRLVQRQKKFGRAQLLSILEASPDRVEPPCPLFGKCGGCQLMHLNYAKQLLSKQQKVIDAFSRIGKIDASRIAPCLPSPNPLRYRNKIQLPVRQGKEGLVLGLYAKSSHDLVEVDHCYIHCPIGEKVFARLQQLLKTSTVTAYDPKTGLGELRHVLIKSALRTQEVLVIFVTTSEESSTELQEAAKQLFVSGLGIKGVVHNINKRHDNVILGRKFQTLLGVDFIHEKLGALQFKVSPQSFFQVNPAQAELLYAKALEFAALTGTEVVLDAYCGVGTLSLFLAKRAKQVIGIECVPEAIQNAKENGQLNGIENVSFVCALSEEYIKTASKVDVVVLNPPRQGCETSLLKSLSQLLPQTIVYISCDPATLARDLSHLVSFGYHVEEAQPFDMFPQTAHVETVVKLRR